MSEVAISALKEAIRGRYGCESVTLRACGFHHGGDVALGELSHESTLAGETLAAIAERGLSAELQRLRDEIMGGKPFLMPRKTRKGRSPK